jgi:hypothetical protein
MSSDGFQELSDKSPRSPFPLYQPRVVEIDSLYLVPARNQRNHEELKVRDIARVYGRSTKRH